MILNETTVAKCETNSGFMKKAKLKNINKESTSSVFFFDGLANQNEFFEDFVKKNILINRM